MEEEEMGDRIDGRTNSEVHQLIGQVIQEWAEAKIGTPALQAKLREVFGSNELICKWLSDPVDLIDWADVPYDMIRAGREEEVLKFLSDKG